MNCKFCGTPVASGRVFHGSCWERQADSIAGDMCDNYCRWPREIDDPADLHELHCNDCHLSRLAQMGQ